MSGGQSCIGIEEKRHYSILVMERDYDDPIAFTEAALLSCLTV